MKKNQFYPVDKSHPGTKILKEKIKHVVVLMLENHSFDNLLGKLYPKNGRFNGLGDDDAMNHHYYTPDEFPNLSYLAKRFAVCDAWHASAPCPSIPNRFFLHTGTAGGYEKPFPYSMPSIFTRFNKLGIENGWRVYYHDFPQTCLLSDMWPHLDQFYDYDQFKRDADAGKLPCYSFIEPGYFATTDVDALIGDVYNSLQASPAWNNTLLVILFSDKGATYDHVAPPAATPPESLSPNQAFAFDLYGSRVPAVIVSPYIAAGSFLRAPRGFPPYDHTSVIATLRQCFNLGDPLTDRDRYAPDLSIVLTLPDDRLNLGQQLSLESPILSFYDQELSPLQKELLQSAFKLPNQTDTLDDEIDKVVQAVENFFEYGKATSCKTSLEALPLIEQKVNTFINKK